MGPRAGPRVWRQGWGGMGRQGGRGLGAGAARGLTEGLSAPRGAEVGDVYPAAEKRLSRSHLALGCRGLLYADSLVLYLNSPGGRDGTMLLWASKENGSESGHPPAGTPGAGGCGQGRA